jgi:hypothetical protein
LLAVVNWIILLWLTSDLGGLRSRIIAQ